MDKKHILEQGGIDYEDGMARFRQREETYFKYLFRLPDDPLCGECVHYFEKGEYEESRRAAHTLKGLAANLSAYELMEKCQKYMETVKSSGTEDSQKALDEMIATHKKAADAIKKIITAVKQN